MTEHNHAYPMPQHPVRAGVRQHSGGAWFAFCVDAPEPISEHGHQVLMCGHAHKSERSAERCLMAWNEWGYKQRHAHNEV